MESISKQNRNDFIYKIIKYSDSEVINNINKFEKVAKKTISNNYKKVAYMNFFI